MYLNPAQDNVSASVELLVTSPADVHTHLLRCLGILGTATGKFLEEMSARLTAAVPADRRDPPVGVGPMINRSGRYRLVRAAVLAPLVNER